MAGMNADRLVELIRAPQVSEKATRLAEAHHQIVFRVRRDATKPEIARAVASLFEVEVAAVTTLCQRGKHSGGSPRHARRSDWKKAYVTLKPGYDIDFVGRE